MKGHKRKVVLKHPTSRKKVKTQHSSTNDLPWKTVSRPFQAGTSADDGILEFEEVDNVEVVYEETSNGRVARFNVLESPKKEPEDTHESESQTSDHELEPTKEEQISFDENLLPEWKSFSLHPQLLRSLHKRQFASPTPIQTKSIPFALSGRDVVGIAQTGSGKTLAYGLPILHALLNEAKSRARTKTKREIKALILAPTRELALQVSSHLNECVTSWREDEEEEEEEKKGEERGQKKSRPPPVVSVAAVVGGMSAQKQRRILERGVDVLIATPGRLWDIIEEDDDIAKQIKSLRFLVLDEADRMIEAGHFAELENILRLTLRQSQEDIIPDDPGLEEEEGDEEKESESDGVQDGLQTFIFSATLSKELQRNVKRRSRPKVNKKRSDKPASTLDDLLLRLDFRDPNPEVIDLSPEGGVVSTLRESKVECLSGDKDAYLYYFLSRYPGKSLVFLGSIDGIRRLMPIMELLGIKAYALHSQLEQRQRLKNLDRFKSTPNAVLLATDIAARGLDVPAVDHVIHYQSPRSADVYVHRNGRTARAAMAGFSLLMCSPDERRMVRTFLGTLGRQENDIPEMEFELDLLDQLKERISLARQIDQAQHKVKKENYERNWMKETAEAMEIELDSDFLSDTDEDKPQRQKKAAQKNKVTALKSELKALLAQPLVRKGISVRYITSNNRLDINDMLAGDYHEGMIGAKKAQAQDAVTKKKKKQKQKPKYAAKEEEEEWKGIL